MVFKDNKKVPQSTTVTCSFYECNACDYTTSDRSNWAKHCKTKRHIKRTMINDDNAVVPQSTTNITSYECECGKQYKYQSGLSRHKKTCTYKTPVIEEQEPQNQNVAQDLSLIVVELLKRMDEQQKVITELVKQTGNNNNNHNNNNSNNNTNIIVQLNNNYPNAIPIQDLCGKIKELPQCVTHNPMLLANTIAELLGHQTDDEKTIRAIKDTMYVKYEETGFKEDKDAQVFDNIKKQTEQDQLAKAYEQNSNMLQNEKESKQYPEMVYGITKPLSLKDKKHLKKKIINTVGNDEMA